MSQRSRFLVLSSLLSIAGLAPGRARAAGFELTTPGARSVGRAGALVAGADDPLGLFINPATILATDNKLNTSAAVHMHFSNTCLKGVEVIENADGTRSAGQTYPNVCDSGPMAVIPELATTLRLSDKLALAVGVYAPPAASAKSSYGNANGTYHGGDPKDPANRTSTRYLLLEQKQLQVFPTLGLAYQLLPQLRAGASFGWGLTQVDFTNAGFTRWRVLGAPWSLTDTANRLQGFDGFVPRVQAGLWGKPSESSPLELGANFVWTQDVKIKDASLRISDLSTDIVPANYRIDEPSHFKETIKKVNTVVPSVSQLSLGARYAHKLPAPVDKIGDRLSRERFDVELNTAFTFGNHMKAISLDLPAGSQVVVPASQHGGIPSFNVPLPPHVSIPHQWKTQYSLRLGGDYNPIPGVLGLRAGVSYDSNGVSQGYQNLDFTPFQNLGLHLGGTVRIASTVDLSLAYAHYVFPNVSVSVKDAGVRRIVAGDIQPGDNAPANAGRFTRSSDVLVAQIDAHF